MIAAGEIVLGILREAWGVLVAVTISFAVLAVLIQVLKSTAGNILGANPLIAQSVTASGSLIVLVLFAFLWIPALVQSIQITAPNCGPVAELGELAALLIGAVVALRMLKAITLAVAMAAFGGPAGISDALLEGGAALFGMLIAVTAVPVAAAFFGAC